MLVWSARSAVLRIVSFALFKALGSVHCSPEPVRDTFCSLWRGLRVAKSRPVVCKCKLLALGSRKWWQTTEFNSRPEEPSQQDSIGSVPSAFTIRMRRRSSFLRSDWVSLLWSASVTRGSGSQPSCSHSAMLASDSLNSSGKGLVYFSYRTLLASSYSSSQSSSSGMTIYNQSIILVQWRGCCKHQVRFLRWQIDTSNQY